MRRRHDQSLPRQRRDHAVFEPRARGTGLFVLVKTSNPSSGEFQDLELAGGGALWERVAARVNGWGAEFVATGGLSPVGAVVGATYPDHARRARALMPRAIILVPGYGTQGPAAAAVANAVARALDFRIRDLPITRERIIAASAAVV